MSPWSPIPILIAPLAEELLARIDRAALASRIAEVHLRFAPLADGRSHCIEALRWFALAIQHGNNSAALIGLVGDALIRLGRYTHSVPHQRRALLAKSVARASGSAGRENLSLCAAINSQLWRSGRDLVDYRNAAAAALEAHNIDQSWAWPLRPAAGIPTVTGTCASSARISAHVLAPSGRRCGIRNRLGCAVTK